MLYDSQFRVVYSHWRVQQSLLLPDVTERAPGRSLFATTGEVAIASLKADCGGGGARREASHSLLRGTDIMLQFSYTFARR